MTLAALQVCLADIQACVERRLEVELPFNLISTWLEEEGTILGSLSSVPSHSSFWVAPTHQLGPFLVRSVNQSSLIVYGRQEQFQQPPNDSNMFLSQMAPPMSGAAARPLYVNVNVCVRVWSLCSLPDACIDPHVNGPARPCASR